MPSKKKVKVFDQYSDAFIYCVNNEIKILLNIEQKFDTFDEAKQKILNFTK